MGIVTGIGDKASNINLIKPELDATVRDYILGKNCILQGLNIIGTTLKAGYCVLKGYVGQLVNDITVSNTYIYGKFVINGNDTVDEFDIETTDTAKTGTNVNPSTITTGTYYLLLYTYTNGAYVLNSALNTPTYPDHSYEADETDLVKSGAEIESGVTGTTQARNDNSTKVATTEYVHKQIQEEIAYDTSTADITTTYSGSVGKIGSITLYRKAKYVKVVGIGNKDYNTVNADCIVTIPDGFKPKVGNSVLVFPSRGNVPSGGYMYRVYLTTLVINTSGNVVNTYRSELYQGNQSDAEAYIQNLQYISGWETD